MTDIERIEAWMAERDSTIEVLFPTLSESESIIRTQHMHDRWELAELERINSARCTSRIVRRLPESAYEAAKLMRYVP